MASNYDEKYTIGILDTKSKEELINTIKNLIYSINNSIF